MAVKRTRAGFTSRAIVLCTMHGRHQTGAGSLDSHLLEQLITPTRQEHLLDPRAIHQVERRLRGLGIPPRSVPEMAEWLRRLGDLSPADLEGPMPVFWNNWKRTGVRCG